MPKVQVELPVPEVAEFRSDAARTAMVIVDLENEFCAPGGKKFGGQEAVEAVQASARLADRVRAAGGRVIWVRSVRDPDSPELTYLGRESYLLRGTWAVEYTPPLKVLPGEPVVEKGSHDCFSHTEMDALLAREGIVPPEWRIVVTGVALGVCVNQAVCGFAVRHFRVGLPLDACAPRTGAHAAATLWRYGIAGFASTVTVTNSELVRLAAPGTAVEAV